MSLDIYLYDRDSQIPQEAPKPRIFIRELGQTKEISRQEWDDRFPEREPVTVNSTRDQCVFAGNITHNLVEMAQAAGLYQCMWRPEEAGFTKAAQLIEPLRHGICLLYLDPWFYRQMNPSNGWGTYELLLEVANSYLAACEEYPEAEVVVSR